MSKIKKTFNKYGGVKDISIGDNVEWKDKKGKVFTGIIKSKTKDNYMICCQKNKKKSNWRVSLNWESLVKINDPSLKKENTSTRNISVPVEPVKVEPVPVEPVTV